MKPRGHPFFALSWITGFFNAMRQYFRIYDWTASIGLTLEERLVYSLILHFTETGIGFYAGDKGLSDRLAIPKATCKAAVRSLQEKGAIQITTATIHNSVRKIYQAKQSFIDNNSDE